MGKVGGILCLSVYHRLHRELRMLLFQISFEPVNTQSKPLHIWLFTDLDLDRCSVKNPHSLVQLRQKNMFQRLLLEVHFLLTPMTLAIMVAFLLILFVSCFFRAIKEMELLQIHSLARKQTLSLYLSV